MQSAKGKERVTGGLAAVGRRPGETLFGWVRPQECLFRQGAAQLCAPFGLLCGLIAGCVYLVHQYTSKINSMIKMLLAILITVSLFSCASKNTEKKDLSSGKNSADTASQKNKPAASNDTGYLVFRGDSVEIPSFEIEVTLSAKAAQKLTHDKETIIVRADFSGMPKDTTLQEYKESGQMSLASSERELITNHIAIFGGIKFPKSLYDSLADKNINLLINVVSGRRSSKDNLLNCDILEDKMSNVKGRRFTLKGKLIYGES